MKGAKGNRKKKKNRRMGQRDKGKINGNVSWLDNRKKYDEKNKKKIWGFLGKKKTYLDRLIHLPACPLDRRRIHGR